MKPEQEEADGGLLSRKEVIARIEKQIRLWNNDTVTMACADMLADLKQMPASDAASRTQMTPEQKQQRIEQIERWSRITREMEETAAKNRISPGESKNEKKLRDDIDFLLSLVKSQEAENKKLKEDLYIAENDTEVETRRGDNWERRAKQLGREVEKLERGAASPYLKPLLVRRER